MQSLDWNLPLLICPLDIALNLSFLLDLSAVNDFCRLLSFCDNITNFVIWNTWNNFSGFAVAAASLFIYSEIAKSYRDTILLMDFIQELKEKLNNNVMNDVLVVRIYILTHFDSLSSDIQLLKTANMLRNINVSQTYRKLSNQ